MKIRIRKTQNKKLSRKGVMAFSQILILIVSIVAIAWLVGMSTPVVKAQAQENPLAPNLNYPLYQKNTDFGTYARSPPLVVGPPTPGGPKIPQTPTTGKSLKDILGGGSVEGESKLPIDQAQNILMQKGGPSIDQAKQLQQQYGITNTKYDTSENLISFEKNGELYTANSDGTFTGLKYTPYTHPLGLNLGPLVGDIAQGLMWAGIAISILQIIGMVVPEKYKPLVNSLSYGVGAGIMAGKTVMGAISQIWGEGMRTVDPTTFWGKMGMSTAGGWGLASGIVVGALVFYLTYKSTEESKEIITFQCNPWDAPVGGKDCEKCNKQALPCSIYQCKSLGQACDLENAGTGQDICFWKNRDDVEPPTIEPWNDALSSGYEYVPAKAILPPDRGVKISNKNSADGCVPAFYPLSFGITTNEPARCKIDYIRKQNISQMDFYFGGTSLFYYNHSQIMSLPGPSALTAENITIENNGEYSLYVKCEDANGNANVGSFVFQFCVQKGPDTTPPEIVSTNLLNGMPIAYNQSSLDLEVYVNEPATCKWSHTDQAYDKMEQDMSCSQSVTDINAQMLYTCKTTLTGIKNQITNNFYFRCKDQPTMSDIDRNVNQQSYKFTVMGSQPLVIDSVTPNNATIKDSTTVVNVTLTAKTSAGYNEGQATCYFSDTGETDSYIMFLNTNSYQHTQVLYLPQGNYTYWIKCIDLGGNADEKQINFNVEVDNKAPVVVRAYKDTGNLRIVTDEPATCVYDTVDCNYLFSDGTKMSSTADQLSSYTTWNTQTNFYIKCEDKYGNQPLPNSCTIVLRPFELYPSTSS